jgi:hypothetical protein
MIQMFVFTFFFSKYVIHETLLYVWILWFQRRWDVIWFLFLILLTTTQVFKCSTISNTLCDEDMIQVCHGGTGLLAMFAACRGGMDYIIFYIKRSLEIFYNCKLQNLDSFTRKRFPVLESISCFCREQYHIAGPMHDSESVFGIFSPFSNLSAHYSELCTDHESNLPHVRFLFDYSKASREKVTSSYSNLYMTQVLPY